MFSFIYCLGFLLTPALVSCKKRSVRFNNIWTGSYFTFAKDKDTGDIYAWGLNNYYQLGTSCICLLRIIGIIVLKLFEEHTSRAVFC